MLRSAAWRASAALGSGPLAGHLRATPALTAAAVASRPVPPLASRSPSVPPGSGGSSPPSSPGPNSTTISSNSSDAGSGTGSTGVRNGGGGGSAASSTSSSAGGPATGSGDGSGGGGESGRECESADSAFRDVVLSRVAALEAEVAALRAAAETGAGGAGAKAAAGGGSGGSEAATGSALNREQQALQPGSSRPGARSEGLVEAGSAGRREREKQGEERGKEGAQDRGDGESGGAAAGEAAQGQKPAGTEAGAAAGGKGDKEAGGGKEGSATEAMAEGLSKLHPKITRLVQSGYLESLHHLRQRLMVDEWEGGGRQRALRRGVADFEAQIAEAARQRGGGGGGEEAGGGKGGGGGPELSWEELSQLYRDPTNLEVIRDPALRMAARATLQRVLDERHEKVRDGATGLAKELADGMTKGPSSLLSGLWGLLPLPIPSFLKPKPKE